MSQYSHLFVINVLILGQVVLLQECRDLICAPKSVVDLAILRLSDCGELNCKCVSIRVLLESIGSYGRGETYSSRC